MSQQVYRLEEQRGEGKPKQDVKKTANKLRDMWIEMFWKTMKPR